MPPPPVDQLPLTVPVFHVLLSLVDQELHGYALIKELRRRTGRGSLRTGTVYAALVEPERRVLVT